MGGKGSSHAIAVLQALFVTFLWSTSWVLTKAGLKEIPALTFAGLRYLSAFLCLLLFSLLSFHRSSLHSITKPQLARLAVLGVLIYAIAQGAQFLGLALLPAVTVSLLLNSTVVVVAILGYFTLAEHPSTLQYVGILLFLFGVAIYFHPISTEIPQISGLAIVSAGVLANALASILGRRINREVDIHPLVVTTVSMGVGSMLLLTAGLVIQGLPYLSFVNWVVVGWLAVINTAFAFTLWNHVQRTLSALESSMINNTMLVQVAILAWLFFGEQVSWREAMGLVAAACGALIVQIRKP